MKCFMPLSMLRNTAILCGLLFLAGCIKAPGTARDQVIFLSEEKEIALGVSAFRDVLRQARLSNNPAINEMVNRVGRRIAAAADKPEYHWEFAVIQDDSMINALPSRRKGCDFYGYPETREERRRAGHGDGP